MIEAKPPLIEPLAREQRLYERVTDKVLTLIKNDTWQPGDRLPPERELADAFGVSRTVVREAIKVLEAQGVLATVTGSGVYVRAPDSSVVSRSLQTYIQFLDQDDMYLRLAEIRRVLEVEIAALAAERATPAQRQELDQLCRRMRQNAASAPTLAELDLQFHLLLADATQNQLFRVLLSPLIEQLREQFLYMWEGYGSRPLERVFAQHEALVEAIQQNDPLQAREMMSQHLAYSAEVLAATLQEQQ
jgi:GntR family transcriptional repressor for pyruvate dehydrogenase complex